MLPTILLARNLVRRSFRNPVNAGIFVILPTILLVVFGSVNSSADPAVFSGLFAIFSGMSLILLGVVGLSVLLPMDKKMGVLRRMQATPFSPLQLMIGFMLSSFVLALISISLMLVVAIVGFNLNMEGSYLDLAVLLILGLVMFGSIGLAIGGWAKDDAVATFVSQIIFLSSIAFGGIWFPRDTLPAWLQTASEFLPLTPVIESTKAIVINGQGLGNLLPEICIIVAWTVVSLALGAKLFRWESNPS